MTTKLTLGDISDLRAYERERDEVRRHIIELKQRRRISIGPIVTLLFENRETIRFQVQEMARAERMLSDEQIQHELDVYNALVPERGQLVATLFVELTSKEELMEWLPKLVGIERSVELRLGTGEAAEVVRCRPEESHASQLTREEVTASVHYVYFDLTPEQVELFANGAVSVAVEHPAYAESVTLDDDSRESLLEDLRG